MMKKHIFHSHKSTDVFIKNKTNLTLQSAFFIHGLHHPVHIAVCKYMAVMHKLRESGTHVCYYVSCVAHYLDVYSFLLETCF